ncbi:MAG TPA: hypothetical protein VGO11_24535 [Chthoniobacteraceae bacterium]|jgi:hypothetical protein|nr:hypothetical protein [Chthoniobacteraceae bacterium]
MTLLLGLCQLGLNFDGYRAAREFRQRTEPVAFRKLPVDEAVREVRREPAETISVFEARRHLDSADGFYLGVGLTLVSVLSTALAWARRRQGRAMKRILDSLIPAAPQVPTE